MFDRHAASYDTVAESVLGTELRRRVHRVVGPLLAANMRVADIGCGTGLDATWLAPQVRSVVAVDQSPTMVELATQRCSSLANVAVHTADVARLHLSEPVDLVLANFGVINCIDDLEQFAERLAALLVPGGRVVAVTMARWCPIELAVGCATLNRGLITRRIRGADYDGLPIRYASARGIAAAFAARFELESAEALGTFLPPFEQRRWVETRPRLHSTLATADRQFARIGAVCGLGDHHIVVLRKQS